VSAIDEHLEVEAAAMRGGAEDEENLIEVQMDAHDSGGGGDDDDDDDDGQASYGEEGAGMSEDEVSEGGEDQGEGQERTGMPRHVQRALWRILVGDPARLGPEPSTHEELIDSLKRSRVLINTRVCRAMELIPRGSFVPEEQQGEAYLDCPLAVPQLGFNISAPHIHATCLEKLGLEPGHHFLDVGSGEYHASVSSPQHNISRLTDSRIISIHSPDDDDDDDFSSFRLRTGDVPWGLHRGQGRERGGRRDQRRRPGCREGESGSAQVELPRVRALRVPGQV